MSSSEQSIHEAARVGNVPSIQNNFHKLECTDFLDRTPLQICCQSGNSIALAALLHGGVDINRTTDGQVTPISIAAERGHADVVKVLVAAHANVNEADCAGNTPLWMACQNNQINTVKELIAARADVNRTNEDGIAPIFVAAREGHADLIPVLAAAGALVDPSDKDGQTPLLAAVEFSQYEVVKALVAAGADINKGNTSGQTPVYLSTWTGDLEILLELLRRGADANKSDKDLTTPVWVAAWKGHCAAMKLLVQFGADINRPDSDGATPAWAAARYGQVDVVNTLMSLGADMLACDNDGASPLWAAAHFAQPLAVQALMACHSSDVNQATRKGDTPLHAIMATRPVSAAKIEVALGTIRTLVALGANPTITNKKGLTPTQVVGGKLANLLKTRPIPAYPTVALVQRRVERIRNSEIESRRCILILANRCDNFNNANEVDDALGSFSVLPADVIRHISTLITAGPQTSAQREVELQIAHCTEVAASREENEALHCENRRLNSMVNELHAETVMLRAAMTALYQQQQEFMQKALSAKQQEQQTAVVPRTSTLTEYGTTAAESTCSFENRFRSLESELERLKGCYDDEQHRHAKRSRGSSIANTISSSADLDSNNGDDGMMTVLTPLAEAKKQHSIVSMSDRTNAKRRKVC